MPIESSKTKSAVWRRWVHDQFAEGTAGATIMLTPQDTSAGGTSFDFTIPSGVTRFQVSLREVSFDAASQITFRLGDGGGIELSGYTNQGAYIQGATTADVGTTDGFQIANTGQTFEHSGIVTFILLNASTNIWACSGVISSTANFDNTAFVTGSKALSAELTTVRMTTQGGTAVGDHGSVGCLHDNTLLTEGATGATGTTGATGATGTAGVDGDTILSGTADPTTEGTDGDWYIQTTDWEIWGPKATGSWPGSGTSLIGPQGDQGIQGIQGDQGIQGIQGDPGDVTASDVPVQHQVAIWDGVNTLRGDTTFTWNGTLLDITGALTVSGALTASGGVDGVLGGVTPAAADVTTLGTTGKLTVGAQDIDVGVDTGGNSNVNYYDDTNNTFRTIRWNDTESVFEFEKDDGTFAAFGTGSGGGPDFLLGGM